MNVTGKTTIYINGFEGNKKGEVRVAISVKVTSKVIGTKSDYVTGFMPVVLSNDMKRNLGVDKVDVNDKIQYNIEINDAWLNTYETKKGNNINLFINDLTILETDEKGTRSYKKQSYRK